MVKLISLQCSGCGGQLSFNGGTATCAYCGSKFALVSDRSDGKRAVSYRPLDKKDGTMLVPLKIQVANLVRESTNCLVADGWFREENFTTTYGKVGYPVTVDDDVCWLAVATARVDKKVTQGRNLWWRPITITTSQIRWQVMYHIFVVNVEDDWGVVVGETVRIDVLSKDFESEANEASRIIKDKFGVIPSVRLVKG